MKIAIKNPEHYYSLIKDAKEKWGRLQNNAYFLTDFLEMQIRQGRLSALILDDALLFFLDHGACEQLYFQASMTAAPAELAGEFQKPVVASLIGTVPPDTLSVSGPADRLPEDSIPQKLRPACHLLDGYGLKQADCYYHMTAAALSLSPISALSGFHFEPACKEQIPEILKLLNSAFSPLTSDLPDTEELIRLIQKKEAFSLTGEDGLLCGYCQYEAQGSKRMLRHLVVAPEYRSRHLGNYILQCLSEAFPDSPSFLWVREDNAGAVKLYQKCGYRFDGRIMINYIS